MILTPRIVLTLTGFVVLCTPPPQGQPEKIKVTVVAILATERNDKVEDELKCIAKEVQKKHPNLKGFKVATQSCQSVAVGEKVMFPLAEKKEAEIVIKHGADKDNWVGLSVHPTDHGEIAYRAVCGKFLPIVTRCKTKNKDVIVIAIRVQPCHKK